MNISEFLDKDVLKKVVFLDGEVTVPVSGLRVWAAHLSPARCDPAARGYTPLWRCWTPSQPLRRRTEGTCSDTNMRKQTSNKHVGTGTQLSLGLWLSQSHGAETSCWYYAVNSSRNIQQLLKLMLTASALRLTQTTRTARDLSTKYETSAG